jgi:hypothetical protein
VYSGITWSPGFTEVTPAHVHHHARAFVAQDGREQAFGISAGQRVVVGVADAGGLDFHQHLTRARAFQVHGFNGQRGTGLPGHGCAGFHAGVSMRLVRFAGQRLSAQSRSSTVSM